ncbi:MAG TPA: peptide chain release factor 1 [Kosmotogaceae bacterium]|nr:MAG: Peptide chain release factor 1 [Thermotogales bacterium 46_20]HAA85238.1 peptide chain release factor 1 [Kosmotogaceae bacterium]
MDLAGVIEVFRKNREIVEKELSDPSVNDDPEKLAELGKKHSHITQVVSSYDSIEAMKRELRGWKEMLQEAGEDERSIIEKTIDDLEEEIRDREMGLLLMLLPEPSARNNIIAEIRPGTGGEEAALFAMDLFRLYMRFSERNSWKFEVIEMNETDLGGIREAVFAIKGKDVFSKMRYESGVHRVQRVPTTESGGRIHTSTVSVAILTAVSEVEVKLDPSELKIDTFRSSGAGGQHVNKTESAVRVTHIPTGLTVAVQKDRSQHQNKAKALQILRAKLYKIYEDQEQQKTREKRRSQIGTGERSEKIRTYNFPQNRVTDHRINFTTYRLPEILDGYLDELLMKLTEADIAERLEEIKAANLPTTTR